MNELIQQVMQRADISEESATQAVDAVLGYLRGKLPAPVMSQIDSYLGGESGLTGEGVVAGAKSMMGAFGKKE